MANTVGPLIKQARTGAGLTQEQLAKQIDGLTAADISKAERGEKELTQTQLRQIAKATGVTQASLLNAAKEDSAAKPAAKKPTSSGSTTKKPTSGLGVEILNNNSCSAIIIMVYLDFCLAKVTSVTVLSA